MANAHEPADEGTIDTAPIDELIAAVVHGATPRATIDAGDALAEALTRRKHTVSEEQIRDLSTAVYVTSALWSRLFANPDLAAESIDVLCQRHFQNMSEKMLVDHPNTPAVWLDAIAQEWVNPDEGDEFGVVAGLARHPNTSEEILSSIVTAYRDSEFGATELSAVAGNPNLPIRDLRALIEGADVTDEEEREILRAAAGHPGITDELASVLLQRAAQDGVIAERLLRNPTVDDDSKTLAALLAGAGA